MSTQKKAAKRCTRCGRELNKETGLHWLQVNPTNPVSAADNQPYCSLCANILLGRGAKEVSKPE